MMRCINICIIRETYCPAERCHNCTRMVSFACLGVVYGQRVAASFESVTTHTYPFTPFKMFLSLENLLTERYGRPKSTSSSMFGLVLLAVSLTLSLSSLTSPRGVAENP
jgi:hypothetical protein